MPTDQALKSKKIVQSVLTLVCVAALTPFGVGAVSLSPDKADWLEVAGNMAGRTETLDTVSVRITEVDNGADYVSIRLKAWDAYGDPIGFGPDGTVEVERFVFRGNLPQFVIDKGSPPSWACSPRGDVCGLKYKEVYDPFSSFRSQLNHTIGLVGTDGRRIVPGRLGNTVTTVYPDADPESSTFDGEVGRTSVDEVWATIRSGNGNYAADSGSQMYSGYYPSGTTDQWGQNKMMSFGFSDPSLGTDTVSSAVVSLYGSYNNDAGSDDPDFAIVDGYHASATAATSSDYQNFVLTERSARIALSTLSTGSYKDFSINSPDTVINKNSENWFGLATEHQIDGTTPTWCSAAWCAIWGAYTADNGSNKPKLTITHTAAAVCGNGTIEGAESCDDGDTDDGDGCSATCSVESGYTCSGEPSVCTPDSPSADLDEWEIPASPTAYDAVAIAAYLSTYIVFLGFALLKI